MAAADAAQGVRACSADSDLEDQAGVDPADLDHADLKPADLKLAGLDLDPAGHAVLDSGAGHAVVGLEVVGRAEAASIWIRSSESTTTACRCEVGC